MIVQIMFGTIVVIVGFGLVCARLDRIVRALEHREGTK
jgi:hypothetical protein